MFRLTRRSLWDHKRRLISTVVAVVLGVAFMAGTFVLSDTINRTFNDLFSTVNKKIDVQVQGHVLFKNQFGGQAERQLLDASLLDQVRKVPGVVAAAPQVRSLGFGSTNRVLGRDGKPVGASQGPPTLIENWVPDFTLSPYRLVHGRGPTAADEIAINVAAADDAKLGVGDPIDVVSQFGRHTYKLVGIFRFGTAKSAAGAVSADFTLAEAQRLTGTTGKYQTVDARGDGSLSQTELAARVRPILPGGTEVITGKQAAAQTSSDVQSGFSFFKIALQVFGGIALLVGAFVISNTFSILVAQRTRELALLRAVGASRGQILGSVLLEASMVGLIAAALGLLAGIGLAKGISAAFAAFGAELPASGLAIRPATILIALVAGVGVTLVAAMLPAIRSTRVRPIAALRDVAIDRSGASRTRVVVGVLVLLFGLLNLSAAWRGGGRTSDLGTVGFGAVLVIIAAIVIGPVVAAPSIRALGSLLPPVRGITGRLATENAARSPKRTSATASALLIGVALVGFITVFAASAKASVGVEVSRGFQGDLVVTSGSGFGPISGFSSSVADQVAAVPGVRSAVGLGFTRGRFTYSNGKSSNQFLSAVDPRKLAGVLAPRMAQGSMTDLTDAGVVIDKAEARDHNLNIADTVHITVPGGQVLALKVQAISDDQQLLGFYTITRATFTRSVPQPTDTLVLASVVHKQDAPKVIAQVEKAIKDTPSLKVLDRKGYIGDLAKQITQFVTVIYVMLALSVIIALIGLGNTLSLSIHERTRELGLLRAVGMNRAQLRSSIRWEAVLISVLGTLVGLALGLGLSRAILQALKGSGLSQYTVPVGSLVVITILAALLGVLASLRPSRRAARLAILDAIAKE